MVIFEKNIMNCRRDRRGVSERKGPPMRKRSLYTDDVEVSENTNALNLKFYEPSVPTTTESIWIVRISTRSGAVKARTDYAIY